MISLFIVIFCFIKVVTWSWNKARNYSFGPWALIDRLSLPYSSNKYVQLASCIQSFKFFLKCDRVINLTCIKHASCDGML